MGQSQITFRKKEQEKKRQLKKQQKQERKEFNKQNNDKGKGLEEMYAYVDEYGNISDKPPVKKYEFKEEDLIRPEVEEVYHFGKVSYYNDQGHYGFIRDNESKETTYFNDGLVGFVLKIDQKVRYKYKTTKQGNQVVEVILEK